MSHNSFLKDQSHQQGNLQQNSGISDGGIMIGGNSVVINQSRSQNRGEKNEQSMIGVSRQDGEENGFLVRRNSDEQEMNEENQFGLEDHFQQTESRQSRKQQASYRNGIETDRQQSQHQSKHMLQDSLIKKSQQQLVHENSFPMMNNQSSDQSSKKVSQINLNQDSGINHLVSKNNDSDEAFGKEESSMESGEKQGSLKSVGLDQSSRINNSFSNNNNRSSSGLQINQQSSSIHHSINQQLSQNHLQESKHQESNTSKQLSKQPSSNKSFNQQKPLVGESQHQSSKILDQSSNNNKFPASINNSRQSSIKGSQIMISRNEEQRAQTDLSQLNNNSHHTYSISEVNTVIKHQQDGSQQGMRLILGSNDYDHSNQQHFPSADSHIQHQNSKDNSQYLDMSIPQHSILPQHNDRISQHQSSVKYDNSQINNNQNSRLNNDNSSISNHQHFKISLNNQQPSKISSKKQLSASELNPSKSSHKQPIIQNPLPTSTQHIRKQSNVSIANHFSNQLAQKQLNHLTPHETTTPNKSYQPDSLKYSQNNTISHQQISLTNPYQTQQTVQENLISKLTQSESKQNQQQTRYQEQIQSNYENQTSKVAIDSTEPPRIQSSRQVMRKNNHDQPHKVEPISMKIKTIQNQLSSVTKPQSDPRINLTQHNKYDDLHTNNHIEEEIYRSPRKQLSEYNDRILQSEDFGHINQPVPGRKRVQTQFDMRQKQQTLQKVTQIHKPEYPQPSSVFQTEIYPNNLSLANYKLIKIREVKELKKKKLEDQLAKISQEIDSLTRKQQQIHQWNSPAKNFNERLKINNSIEARQKALSLVKNLQKQRKTREMQKISSIDKIDAKITDYMSELTKIRIQNELKMKQRRKLQVIQRMKSKEMKKINQMKKIQASSKFVSQFTKGQHKQNRGSLLSPRGGNRDAVSPESGRRKSTRQSDYDEGLTPQLANKKAYLNRVRNLSQKKSRNHLHHEEKVDMYQNKLY